MAVRESILRFVRAVGSAAIAGGITAAIAAGDSLRDVVTNVVAAIPFLTVENETTVSFIVFAVLTASLLAIDKELRDRGVYPGG